jgi:hypothetical protein
MGAGEPSAVEMADAIVCEWTLKYRPPGLDTDSLKEDSTVSPCSGGARALTSRFGTPRTARCEVGS